MNNPIAGTETPKLELVTDAVVLGCPDEVSAPGGSGYIHLWASKDGKTAFCEFGLRECPHAFECAENFPYFGVTCS